MRKSYDKSLVEYNELKRFSDNHVIIIKIINTVVIGLLHIFNFLFFIKFNKIVQQMVSKISIPFVKDREFIDHKFTFNC
jgi:hypothetical protein